MQDSSERGALVTWQDLASYPGSLEELVAVFDLLGRVYGWKIGRTVVVLEAHRQDADWVITRMRIGDPTVEEQA